jgi:hypothetical protein
VIKRVFLTVAAASAFGAAAAVLIVAGAYAVFALARDQGGMSSAAAAGIVALVVALALGITGLVLAFKERKPPPSESNVLDRATALLREHPVLGAGAALVAGIVALKNPKLTTTILSAFLASRAGAKDRRR